MPPEPQMPLPLSMKRWSGGYDVQGMGPKGSLPCFLLAFTFWGPMQRVLGVYLGEPWASLGSVFTV